MASSSSDHPKLFITDPTVVGIVARALSDGDKPLRKGVQKIQEAAGLRRGHEDDMRDLVHVTPDGRLFLP